MANDHNIEKWLPVKGYNDLYSVSNFGRVKSEDRTVLKKTRWGGVSYHRLLGKVINPGVKSNGYLFVGLSKNNIKKYRMVHTLVIEAFVGDRPNGMDVSHEDNDKTNNHISNLCYKTHYENVLDRARHGVERKGETVPTSVLSEEQVKSIRLLSAKGASNRDLADKYGIGIHQIRRIVKRKQWRHI